MFTVPLRKTRGETSSSVPYSAFSHKECRFPIESGMRFASGYFLTASMNDYGLVLTYLFSQIYCLWPYSIYAETKALD
jgi:hypothetical protein